MSDETIKKIIEELLERLGIPHEGVEHRQSELEGYKKFVINTEESGLLIGRDGKHLAAFSLVARTVVKKKTGEDANFFIDVGGYQSTKIQEVQKLALTMAERARTFKRNVELPPMSSYERLWVHSTLSGDSELETESEGEGKFRRVVIKYMPDEKI